MTTRRRLSLEARFARALPQSRRDPDQIVAELSGEDPSTAARSPELTRREREVVLAVVEHASHKRAAAELGISVQTVKNHVSDVFAKVGAHHMSHAVWLLWPVLGDAYVLPGRIRPRVDRRLGYERRRSGREAA